MHAIQTKHKEHQQDVLHWMLNIGEPSMIRMWSEVKGSNRKPLVLILKDNAHLNDLEWTDDVQPKLMTVGERYTSQGASEASRVHRWRLACFLFLLGDTEDCNNVSWQCYKEWPAETGVDSSISRSLRDTFLPMFVDEPAEYCEPDQDNTSREAVLPKHDRHENAHPNAPSPQMAILFWPLSSQVYHLKWWLTKYLQIMWIHCTCMQKLAMLNT